MKKITIYVIALLVTQTSICMEEGCSPNPEVLISKQQIAAFLYEHCRFGRVPLKQINVPSPYGELLKIDTTNGFGATSLAWQLSDEGICFQSRDSGTRLWDVNKDETVYISNYPFGKYDEKCIEQFSFPFQSLPDEQLSSRGPGADVYIAYKGDRSPQVSIQFECKVPISLLAISSDGSVIVVCKADNTVSVIGRETGSDIFTCRYPLPVEVVGMNKNGSTIVVRMRTVRGRTWWEWFKERFFHWCTDDALVFAYEHEILHLKQLKQMKQFLSCDDITPQQAQELVKSWWGETDLTS